jgi:iron-sulfur cluster repair protein YtfE (RIC family)
MDIGHLRSQHQELSQTVSELSSAITSDRAAQNVAPLRWKMARQLIGHLALEDKIFYPTVQRLADKHIRDTARRLEEEMGPLADAFSAYMARWTDERIAREWLSFCAETREILKALTRRIDTEERLLYPLVERASRANRPISDTA